ncbi:hypothetical protein [Tolypothrix sp. VBCCA 56010]|uniref:hypothetical protein n=1 Tax=Tolypothrix sp. VBCCA 56010 TaxID=3137731 RepID=UPI003D7E6213
MGDWRTLRVLEVSTPGASPCGDAARTSRQSRRQVLQRGEPPFGFATSTGRKPTPPSGLTATHCLPNALVPHERLANSEGVKSKKVRRKIFYLLPSTFYLGAKRRSRVINRITY